MLTVGHGTLPAEDLRALLAGAGVTLLVDVRRHPGSRRHPHVARDALAVWLPEAGIAYRWEEALGDRRRGVPDSPNTGLRNASFRAYADYMATAAFRTAATRLVAVSARQPTAVLCAESLWWRCHRRLLADYLSLVERVAVRHLGHDGSLTSHTLTGGARPVGDHLVYAEGGTPSLPGLS
ncbi:MAG: DUF488 family protein [Nitriliruptorales bacterium]|nr:DUF488 family protein [Nitriliruptorales bacterium]